MKEPCKAGVAQVSDRVAAPAVTRHAFPRVINFLLVPDFTFMAYSAAVEPLRLANRISGRELYTWNTISPGGGPTIASNGVAVKADYAVWEEFPPGVMLVCGGVDVQRFNTPWLLARLRKTAAKGGPMGAVCTGSLLLADARLLDGYRCTIHWEHIAPCAKCIRS